MPCAAVNFCGDLAGVMTDPFSAGRGDPVTAGGNPNAYADEDSLAYAAGNARSKSERDAYAAMSTEAPPATTAFAQRWSVWAAGFGGSQTTDGNAAPGSNGTNSSIYGTAVGADYRLSRDRSRVLRLPAAAPISAWRMAGKTSRPTAR